MCQLDGKQIIHSPIPDGDYEEDRTDRAVRETQHTKDKLKDNLTTVLKGAPTVCQLSQQSVTTKERKAERKSFCEKSTDCLKNFARR